MRAFAVVLPLALASMAASAENLRTTERPARATYADGTAENYMAVYTGVVDLAQNESGEASTLTHPIDDRRCSWSLQTYVRRQIFQVNKAGHRSIYEKLTTVFSPPAFHNEGTSLNVWTLHPGNCNDTRERRDSDINNAKSALINGFQTIVNSDVEKLSDVLRNELQAAQVKIQ